MNAFGKCRPKAAVFRVILPGQAMRYYRLYFIDPKGHIEDVRECMAADDGTAMAEARALEHRAVIEIWCRGQKVSEVQPAALRRIG